MDILDYSSIDICRLCEKSNNLSDIFINSNRHVLNKIRSCADVIIEKDDQLPKLICKTCEHNLELSYKFKIQCEYTDRKFRDAIAEAKEKLIKIEIDTNELETYNIQFDGNIIVEENEYDSNVDESNILIEEDQNNQIEIIKNEMIEEENNQTNDEQMETNIILTATETTDQNISKSIQLEGISRDDPNYSKILNEIFGVNGDQGVSEEDNDSKLNDLEKYTEIEYDKSDFIQVYNTLEDEDTYGNEEEEKEGYIEQLDDNDDDDDNDNNDNEYYTEVIEEQISNDEFKNENRKDNFKSEEHSIIYKCTNCELFFETNAELKKHKKSHTKKRYQCNECQKYFSKPYHLKNHQIMHSKTGDGYKCEPCNKRYTNLGNLDRHIRVFHNKERPYVCDKCGKGFSQSSILRQHHAVHIEERQFDCKICHKLFKTPKDLELHEDRHLPRDLRKTKPYPQIRKVKAPIKICVCTFCGKKSNSVALHQSHIRTHTGEKPYECTTCHKKFSFQQSLRSHLLLHTGEKPFKCELCGLSFRQIGHLKGHRLVHTGEKLHQCLVCNKSFALRCNLTVHMRLHTGETPYHCDMCSKKFYDSNALKRHKLSHCKTSCANIKPENQSDSNDATQNSSEKFGFDEIIETKDDQTIDDPIQIIHCDEGQQTYSIINIPTIIKY